MRSLNLSLTLVLGLLTALDGTASAQPDPSVASPPVVVRAADFGVSTDVANNAPALQRASAAAVAARPPGRLAVLDLPCGTLPYEGEIVVDPDSLVWQGCGGARVSRAIDPAGAVYYPVRRVDETTPGAPVTVLRVRDGALSRMTSGPTATRITLAPADEDRRHHFFALRDLVLDGNEPGQLDFLRAQDAAWLKTNLQDSPSHTGLNASNHGNVDVCVDRPLRVPLNTGGWYVRQGQVPGLFVEVTRVSVTGYAATGLLGARCSRWALTEVVAGRSAYNHSVYHADGGGPATALTGERGAWGGWTDVTLTGHAWHHVVSTYGLRATRLVYERPPGGAGEVTSPHQPADPLGRNVAEAVGTRGGRVEVHGWTTTDPAMRLFTVHEGTAERFPSPGPPALPDARVGPPARP